MPFATGPYAKRSQLPPPTTTKLVTTEKIDAATRRNVRDSDGNPEPMRDTASRVMLLLAYAIQEPEGIISVPEQQRLAQRARDALSLLVKEGAISQLEVLFQSTSWGKQLMRVKYYDELRSKPTALTFGPTWTNSSWSAGTPGSDGTLRLASWMTYECATAETTAQTSASTLRTGFAADAPRGFSRDGSTWYLLGEPEAVNLVTDQDVSGAGWSSLGTPVVTGSISDPAGGASAYRIDDNDGAAVEHRFRGVTYQAGAMTLSSWARHDGGTGAGVLREGATGGADLSVPIPAAATAWARYVDSTASHPGGADQVVLSPRSVSADTGAVDFYGVQLEAGLYPTSFIDGTRAAANVALDAGRLMPHGWVDLGVGFATPWANTGVTGEHDLVHFDGADHRFYFDGSDDKLKLIINGTEIESSALTFAAYTAMTARVASLPSGLSLVVSGADSGDGTTTGASAGRIAPPASLWVGGDSSGVQESILLSSITSRATSP